MKSYSYTVCVTDAPFNAKGDGVTNDRAAIQAAIDDVYAHGGGTVLLTPGRVFLSAGIVLRSTVTLLFGSGSELLQSSDPGDYVKPSGDGYVPYRPGFGHNFSPEIKWSHLWYKNYPFIFAPEDSHDFAVRGEGTIRMMPVTDPERLMRICPIGFYRCTDFEIRDVHITNYHGYALMPFTCSCGLFSSLKVDCSNYGNGDGICLMNCRDIRVTGCEMDCGDDAVYIFSSYRDPRKSEWWSSDEPQASENIEIDGNRLKTNHCKAFAMILWGIECEDPEKVEVRNVYVHDNYFETMGIWLWNPYSSRGTCPPVTGVRFENNVIDGIESNFFEMPVSDMMPFRSMTDIRNGNFEQGRCFWVMRGKCGVRRAGGGEISYGYAEGNGENAALYQGVYLTAGRPLLVRALTRARGEGVRLFVRSSLTDELIASAEILSADFEETLLAFEVPVSGNYRIGIESYGGEGRGCVTDMRLAAHPAAEGFDDIVFDRGKMIYRYPGGKMPGGG